MLGIETVTTAGYGKLRPSDNCNFFVLAFVFSTIINIIIDGIFASVVYVKLNRPKDRKWHESIFSKNAVVC